MRRGVAGLLLVLVLTLAGCGASGIPEPRAEAVPVDEMACTDRFSGEPAAVAAGTIPDDVDVVAVLRCTDGATYEDEAGVWSAHTIERFEGDMTSFLDAASAPSDPPRNGPCSLAMSIVPDLWVETSDGRFVRVSYPTTECFQPKSEQITAAIDGLTLVYESVTPIALIESSAALSAGCPSRASILVLGGATQLDDSHVATDSFDAENGEPGATVADVPVVPSEFVDPMSTSGLRVCEYSTTVPAHPSVPAPVGVSGRFVGVHQLNVAAARPVLEAVAAAPPAAECGQIATRFVVVFDLASAPSATPPADGMSLSAPPPSIALELDGCGRVIDAALQPLGASPELVALLSP